MKSLRQQILQQASNLKPLTLDLTVREMAALRELVKTGLYGVNEAQAAERLIARALEARKP